MTTELLPLPEDDEALIFRGDTSKYNLPRPQTFAKWASRPSEAPCELPYVQVGRRVAYRARTLRQLQQAMTYRHSAERAEAQRARRSAAP